MHHIIQTALLLWTLLFYSMNASADEVVFPTPVDHCVAWKAHKKMFLVGSSEPVGINCKIGSRLVTLSDGLVQAELTIPIKGFDSQDEGRDEYVFEALKGNIQPSLILRTKPSSMAELEKIWSTKAGTITAEIEIGKRRYPVKVPYTVAVLGGVPILKGKSVTTFTELGLERPKMVGGVVASVDNRIELHYQLRRDRF